MWPCIKLKHLEQQLQSINGFEKPKILLEQYVTPVHLASHMLHTIQSQYGDIDGKSVADLGCGCGMLTIGASLLNARFVTGFELDLDAIEIYQENNEMHEMNNIEVICCDIIKQRALMKRFYKQFDTVIMNPPFGTKHNAGTDVKFLEIAFELTSGTVYSLHKSSTRSHILKYTKNLGIDGEVLAELRYDLPSSYKFHKKNSVDIQVDFFRFTTT